MSEESSKPTSASGVSLLALNMGLPANELVVNSKPTDKIVSALESSDCQLLWVRGPGGVGRSTLVYDSIERLSGRTDGFLGALRVECWPGLRIEQVLWSIGEFLKQLGIELLYRVLHEQTTLATKMRLLLQIVRDHRVWIWLDDFENIEVPESDSNGNVLGTFLETIGELGDFQGRLVVVTEKNGPDRLRAEDTPAVVFDVHPGDALDCKELWGVLKTNLDEELPDSTRALAFDEIPEDIRNNPLALRLYLHYSIPENSDGQPNSRTLRASQDGSSTVSRGKPRRVVEAPSGHRRPLRQHCQPRELDLAPLLGVQTLGTLRRRRKSLRDTEEFH